MKSLNEQIQLVERELGKQENKMLKIENRLNKASFVLMATMPFSIFGHESHKIIPDPLVRRTVNTIASAAYAVIGSIAMYYGLKHGKAFKKIKDLKYTIEELNESKVAYAMNNLFNEVPYGLLG